MSTPHPVRTLLVGGHESADGADLVRLEGLVDGALAAQPGRRFHNTVSEALGRGETVVVVPMTFGRNPTMVADTAKTLKWLAAKHPGRVALAAPFGSIDHLTAWLRTAANTVRATDPHAALVVVADRSNPFDEAELHRVAYLVATHGALADVVPAILDDDVDVAATVERLRLVGVDTAVVVPAGFSAGSSAGFGTGALANARSGGALMSDGAIVRVIRTRVADAREALPHGHDGIEDGLAADHGHGYAHSHAFEESQGAHPHAHPHPHPHTHSGGQPHTHVDGTVHTHDNDGLHAHVHAS